MIKCHIDVRKDIISTVNRVAVNSRAFSPVQGEDFILQVNNPKQANIVANQINRDYKEGLFRPSYSDPDNFYTIDPSEGLINRYLQSHQEYLQTSTEENIPKASPETLKKVNLFLERIGVDVKTLDKIVDSTGQTISANGRANLLKGLIEVVNGKEDKALTEEAMHFAVDIIEQKNKTLFNSMLSKVGEYQLYKDIINDNSENSYRNLYQTPEGKPDIRKIKKEVMGKLLAEAIIKTDTEKSYPEEKAGLIQQWWKSIKEFLANLFSKSNVNPFNIAAKDILSGKNIGKASDIKGAELFYSRNDAIIKANMKLVGALNLPKARDIFSRFYQKGQRDIFFNKLTSDLQAPKNQVEILKQWVETHNPSSVDDMITGIASEMSYVIEINTAKDKKAIKDNGFAHHLDGLSIYEDFELEGDVFKQTNEEDFDGERHVRYFKNNKRILKRDFEEAAKKAAIIREETPTQHYSNLTVLGGTNYTENEIATPAIVPSIKGHAQFATDNGIGWGRWDEKIQYTEKDINSLIDILKKSGQLEINCK